MVLAAPGDPKQRPQWEREAGKTSRMVFPSAFQPIPTPPHPPHRRQGPDLPSREVLH